MATVTALLVQTVIFLVKTSGHVAAGIMLLVTAGICSAIEYIGRFVAGIAARFTFAIIEQDSVKLHDAQRVTTSVEDLVYEPNSHTHGVEDGPLQIIDEKATNEKQKIATEALINKTKLIVLAEFGSKDPDLLAEDFQFLFPVVGPLGREEFVQQFSSFKLRDAFPDSRGNFFNFFVDPIEPNRVWFFSRGAFTHTQPLKLGGMTIAPKGKKIFTTPQVLSMSFDRAGRCYKLTGGYCVDRTAGNTDGLGGVFGIVHALGGTLPFPEGKPWTPSMQWETFAKRVPQIGKDFMKLHNIYTAMISNLGKKET